MTETVNQDTNGKTQLLKFYTTEDQEDSSVDEAQAGDPGADLQHPC